MSNFGRYEKHGNYTGGKSREYSIYWGMISRCYNKNQINYPNYGGRGIEVCSAWKRSFQCFLNDMGRVPENHSLDRIDNNGHYSPDNCKWSTRLEQSSNNRKVIMVTIDGETKHVSEWLRVLGITKAAYNQRLTAGATREEALRRGKSQRSGIK